MAVDISSAVGQVLPKFTGNIILYIIIAFVVFGLIGIGFYFILRNRKYNLTFVIYKDVAGRVAIVDRVKGMKIKFGTGGEDIFFVKKYKKYLPMGNIQMGKNIFWYYVDKAGHWHNIGIEFIDVKRRDVELNMQLQMDYAKTSLETKLEKRHEDANWLRQHWADVLAVGTIAILLVFIWLIARDGVAYANTNAANAKAITELQNNWVQKYANLLTATDNICSNHGLAPIPNNITGGT